MFRKVLPEVWAFDAEWIPDPQAGKLLYKLDDSLSDKEVMEVMWKEGGATEEDPMPYLKTIQCRIVSVSAVVRRDQNGSVSLDLLSLPRDTDNQEELKESHIIDKFLGGIGKRKPQLVGYNSHSADIKIFIQRGIVNGLSMPDFAKRPEKPWEGVDYFYRDSDYNVDMKEVIGGWGKSTPSLNELSTLSGVPGKIDVDGQQVANMWLEGKIDEIVAYNEFDALTTYLSWLRLAHFGGFFDEKEYLKEQELVRELIERLIPERDHLTTYLNEWNKLQEKIAAWKK